MAQRAEFTHYEWVSSLIDRLSAPPQAFRILVVDDSPSIRNTVVDTLERAGFQVTSAKDGEEALRLTLEKLFDLVVSDVEMGAITGVQLCRVLRSDPGTANLPIILLTAATEAVNKFWGRHAGADAYITKQNMKAELVSTVNDLLEGRSPTGGSLHPQHKGSPLERLSSALDRHLFNAVVISETRKLMEPRARTKIVCSRSSKTRRRCDRLPPTLSSRCSDLSAPPTQFMFEGHGLKTKRKRWKHLASLRAPMPP